MTTTTSFSEPRAYSGKLNHPPYAIEENFVMSFPKGMSEKAPVWVFSTWSEHSDGTKKKSFIDIKGTVSIDSKHRFSVKGGDYYAFDGVFPMDRNDGALEVTLKGDRGFVAVFTLDRLEAN